MKKTYVKPEVYFENFELSTNIATGCEYKSNHTQQDQCGYVVTGVGNVFLHEVTGCTYKEPDQNNPYGLCYHTPVDSSNLFTS